MYFPSDFIEKVIHDTLTGDATITAAVGSSITSLVTLPSGMSLPAIRYIVELVEFTGVVSSDLDNVSEATGRVRVSVFGAGQSASPIRPINDRQFSLLNAIRNQAVTIDGETWTLTFSANSEALPDSGLDGAEFYAHKGTVYDVEMFRS